MNPRKASEPLKGNKDFSETDDLISKIGEENYCHAFDSKQYRDFCFKLFTAQAILSKLSMEMLMPVARALDLQLKLENQRARKNGLRKKLGKVNKSNVKKL